MAKLRLSIYSILFFWGGLSDLNASVSSRCLAAMKAAMLNEQSHESFESVAKAKEAFDELKKETEELVAKMSDQELYQQLDTWIQNTIALRSTSDGEGYLPGQSPKTRTRNLSELLELEKKERGSLANLIGNTGSAESSYDVAFSDDVETANMFYNLYKEAVYPNKLMMELHKRLYKENYPEILSRQAAKNYFEKVKSEVESRVGAFSRDKLIAEVSQNFGDAGDLLVAEMSAPGSIMKKISESPAYKIENNREEYFGTGKATFVVSLGALKVYETNLYKLKLLQAFLAQIRGDRPFR